MLCLALEIRSHIKRSELFCFYRRVIFIEQQLTMSGQNKNLFTVSKKKKKRKTKQLYSNSTSLNSVADNQLTH